MESFVARAYDWEYPLNRAWSAIAWPSQWAGC